MGVYRGAAQGHIGIEPLVMLLLLLLLMQRVQVEVAIAACSQCFRRRISAPPPVSFLLLLVCQELINTQSLISIIRARGAGRPEQWVGSEIRLFSGHSSGIWDKRSGGYSICKPSDIFKEAKN